jgi:hypothetical protein
MINVMMIGGRERERKEEVKKERTDRLPIYIFEKEVQAQCVSQLRFDLFVLIIGRSILSSYPYKYIAMIIVSCSDDGEAFSGVRCEVSGSNSYTFRDQRMVSWSTRGYVFR